MKGKTTRTRAGRGAGGRRARILGAARKLFFAKGYRGTSIEQIARQAGYSKRTVYLDFLNKDDLFLSVCAEGMEILLEGMKRIPAEGLSMEEFIDRFLDVMGTFSREHPRYLRMLCVEATPEILANCSPAVRRRAGALERAGLRIGVERIEKAVAAGIIPPIDPWEAAGIFLGSATGIVLLSLGGSQTVFSKKTLESMGKKAGWLLWQGLRAGVGPSGPPEHRPLPS